MLKVVEAIDICLDLFIYATTRSWLIDWGKYSENGASLGKIIRMEESEVKKLKPKSKLTDFRKEILTYTYQYRPIGKAEIIFVNPEDQLQFNHGS